MTPAAGEPGSGNTSAGVPQSGQTADPPITLDHQALGVAMGHDAPPASAGPAPASTSSAPTAWLLTSAHASAPTPAWLTPVELSAGIAHHPTHRAPVREHHGLTDVSSGTTAASSGSAGASAGSAGAPMLGLLCGLALVAACCWSRLVLLLRRYRANVCLALPERPG